MHPLEIHHQFGGPCHPHSIVTATKIHEDPLPPTVAEAVMNLIETVQTGKETRIETGKEKEIGTETGDRGMIDMRIATVGNLIDLGIQREKAAGGTMRGPAVRVVGTENLALAGAGAEVEAEVAAGARVCRFVVWVPIIVQARFETVPKIRLLHRAIWPS